MYPEMDKIEKEQVEWVFSLTGGELADAPLRFAEVKTEPYRMAGGLKGSVLTVRRWWRRWWYDGVPEYARRDLTGGWDDQNYITIVTDCLFGEPPKKIIAKGKVWRRVAVYTSSGEGECPGHGRAVAEDEAKDGRCPLCEDPVGKEHGMIYLGDGWAEVVYRTRS